MAKIITNGLGIELHGKAGNAVFVETANGLVLRPLTTPHNPRTTVQQANRSHFGRAASFYKTLSLAQFAAWKAYALTVVRQDARGGTPTHPTAYNAFVGLANKYLQVHPNGTPPSNPPIAPFFGDGITVTATGSTGQIAFTASGANAASIVTELLLQPLAHAGRAPKPNLYRPKLFSAYTSVFRTSFIFTPAGWYAPAYRFVNSLTGQEGELIRLAAVQVT